MLIKSVPILKGPLAHLVERTHGMGEASGSSPLWSTKFTVHNFPIYLTTALLYFQ